MSLVDVGAAGNLDRVSKDITDEIAGAAVKQDQHQQQQEPLQNDEDAKLPPRMRGKSRLEIAEMYANIEASHGRMANELGTQRSLTDRLLDLKRTSDLEGNSPVKVKVTRDEILAEDPTPSIERLIDARLKPIVETLDQRLNQVATGSAQAAFVSKHPDYQQIAGDPDFGTWLSASNIRIRAAQAAKGGDWGSADDLLTEYKASKKAKPNPNQEQNDVNLEEARNAGFESGANNTEGGTGKKTGKVYNRNDLIKLRMDDPEKYYSEDFQDVILKAYSEGRVK